MNEIMGPLLKILSKMGRDIANFIVILSLTLFTFACVGMILFSNIKEFSTVKEALLTLFSWMLGSFSFETMAPFGLVG